MAIFRQGDMWSVLDEVDHFIVTTNNIVKSNGALVMGAGLAKQLRDRGSINIDKKYGAAVLTHGRCTPDQVYGVILNIHDTFGAFQVKQHYKDAANTNLILFSAGMLKAFALSAPNKIFAMNFPGIGNGKLFYDEVKPIVDLLPNNVQVWTY